MYILIMNDKQITENAYLEMAQQFKDINDKKNNLIKQLKKSLMVLYSLIKTADENGDLELVILSRQVASEMIDEYILHDD